MEQTRMENMEREHMEARVEMRRRLLQVADPALRDLYYHTITLAEHEAARRMKEAGNAPSK
jgi:hypothetical protein